jgi:hypothetical protein
VEGKTYTLVPEVFQQIEYFNHKRYDTIHIWLVYNTPRGSLEGKESIVKDERHAYHASKHFFPAV